MLAASGVINSPSTLVPAEFGDSISSIVIPLLHVSIRLTSELRAIISSMDPSSASLAWSFLTILYPPNATIVTPTPTPAAIKNCGDESSAKTAGATDRSFQIVPGGIFLMRLLISASVSATAAMASGFFCRVEIVLVTEYWRQLASSRSPLTRPTRPLS